jgi:hypothetical protein
MSAWNASGCNTGGDDFPRFLSSGTAEQVIEVRVINGVGDVCASITSYAHNGTDAVLTLWTQVREGSRNLSCTSNSGAVADNIAHELGHYLGLSETLCTGYIMGVQSVDPSDTSQSVQPEECSQADSNSSTPNEVQRESPPPPDGGAVDPGPGAVDCCSSPILLDLKGDGFRLTSPIAGVRFDLNGDGQKEQTAWTEVRDDAFLVLDRNANGWIDDGWELFGDATPQPLSEERNGYRALAAFDDPALGGNADGWISAADAIFPHLRLWTDRSHDGISQEEEITSLQDSAVKAIELTYKASGRQDRYGNELRFWSWVEIEDLRRGQRPFVQSADVFFQAAH